MFSSRLTLIKPPRRRNVNRRALREIILRKRVSNQRADRSGRGIAKVGLAVLWATKLVTTIIRCSISASGSLCRARRVWSASGPTAEQRDCSPACRLSGSRPIEDSTIASQAIEARCCSRTSDYTIVQRYTRERISYWLCRPAALELR
jgi:hypothetical protein